MHVFGLLEEIRILNTIFAVRQQHYSLSHYVIPSMIQSPSIYSWNMMQSYLGKHFDMICIINTELGARSSDKCKLEDSICQGIWLHMRMIFYDIFHISFMSSFGLLSSSQRSKYNIFRKSNLLFPPTDAAEAVFPEPLKLDSLIYAVLLK